MDHLIGPKENVIIGKLIPAGTGMKHYRNIELSTDNMLPEEDEEAVEDDIILDDAPEDTDETEASAESEGAEETEETLV